MHLLNKTDPYLPVQTRSAQDARYSRPRKRSAHATDASMATPAPENDPSLDPLSGSSYLTAITQSDGDVTSQEFGARR